MRARSLKVPGFTLIEMLITLAILGLLAGLAVPTLEFTVKRQKEQELHNALREIRQAIDDYKKSADEGKVARKADESGYPPSLEALYQGVQDISVPQKKLIYFMRRLPRDPFYPDSSVNAAATWGKRSYDSDWDKPRDGKDVYDVYSYSPDTALDGTRYRDW